MNNVSLARIMYGTEDFHGPRVGKRPRLSAVALPMPANRLAAWELPTLQELVRKAWEFLIPKR
jgi:hypothetical protein